MIRFLGPRCGHYLVYMQQYEAVFCLGGHFKHRAEDLENSHKWTYKMAKTGIFNFNNKTDHWSMVKINGDTGRVNRSGFSACTIEQKTIICGGIIYDASQEKATKLSITEVTIISFSRIYNELVANIVTLNFDMNFNYGWSPNIASGAMIPFKNGTQVLIFGGINDNKKIGLHKRNTRLIVLDLTTRKGALHDLPLSLCKKVMIFGASAHSMNHSIIFLGGSMPVAGKKNSMIS